jgi:crotonobetainyl-CoA:carnitine CoA-transferase CaiB-like acyl-CoA transferase
VTRDSLPEALTGLRVIELPCLDTMPFMAAAMAAKSFADFGAEVIKVEPPRTGAQERQLGPFRDDLPDSETGGLHLFLNTNKSGVTLDLENADDRVKLFRLLEHADILLNPNLPSLNERIGLDPRELTTRFPELIVVSLTTFGIDSIYRNLRGGDLVATHMSGVGYETPWHQVTDPPNQPPLKLAGRQSDYLCGYTAAAAAMVAIFDRARTGAGQHVDVSQWLAMTSMVRPNIGGATHESPKTPAYQRLNIRRKAGAQWVYPCADGWASFNAGTERFWQGWKNVMSHPEWMDTEIFKTTGERAAHVDVIEAAIHDWLSGVTKQEAFEKAQSQHVPCFPVHNVQEVAENAQYQARDFYEDHDHPLAKRVRTPGAPCRFSRTPWRIKRGAPKLGEHNRQILEDSLAILEADRKRATAKRLPFEGIRVLDFGWIFAVPHATAWLGCMGAEVIRVESMRAPDLVRFLTGTDGVVGANLSGVFHSINWSRKSLALDLSRPEGQEIARRLVHKSDIVTENYTVGNMQKYGLDYESLRRLKPDLIMMSGTPLGQDGPFARTVGFGPTTQAFAGLCHLTGYPGEFPCGIGGTWPDFAVGTGMVFFLLAALHHRNRTGEGQYLDLSMAEMVTTMIPEAMMDWFMNHRDKGPIGNRDPSMAPHGVFPVAGDDRWVAISIASDEEFQALCDVLDIPGLAADRLYARLPDRLRNVAALENEIAARTRNFDRDDLVRRLRDRGIAAGPVYNTLQLMNDEAFSASGVMFTREHGESGARPVPGLPVKFSALEPDYRGAPRIGQDSGEILSSLLNLNAAEIARLKEEKVLF